MRRGDLVIVTLSGDYGKPRPGLIVQSDAFDAIPSVTVLPLTSDLHPVALVRLPIDPNQINGLRQHSHIMIDKAMTVPWGRVGEQIGQVDAGTMRAVSTALARFLELE